MLDRVNNQIHLHDVIALARQAGEAIMDVYRGADAGVTSKADNSPLTLADLASHDIIVKGLAELTPDIPVLSEEASNISYEKRKLWQRFWLVDPLDGTKEFIKRNGEFTVNIALIEHGEPVMGVVYAPVLDTCYFGAEGHGAFKMNSMSTLPPLPSGQAATCPPVGVVDCLVVPSEGWGEGVVPIHVQPSQFGQPIKVVASRSHSDERTIALLEKLGNYECISMGSSLKLCLVAEGKAHFYPRLGPTMEWDTAAAHAIVNAAGGEVSDRTGEALIYNKLDLHNPEFFVHARSHEQLTGIIKGFGQ